LQEQNASVVTNSANLTAAMVATPRAARMSVDENVL